METFFYLFFSFVSFLIIQNFGSAIRRMDWVPKMSFPIPTDSGQCQPSLPSYNLLILIFLRNNQPWYVWAFFVWERARIGGIKAETIPSVTAIRQIAVKRRRKVGFDWSNASTHLSSRQIRICPQNKYTFVLKTNGKRGIWLEIGQCQSMLIACPLLRVQSKGKIGVDKGNIFRITGRPLSPKAILRSEILKDA